MNKKIFVSLSIVLALTANAMPMAKVTPLHEAAQAGDFSKVKVLLNEPEADANVRDITQSTPLHYVVDGDCCKNSDSDHVECIKLLLDKGAYIDAKDCHGWTPLHHASLKSNIPCIKILLARGANVRAIAKSNGKTAQKIAREAGYGQTADLLDAVEQLTQE
ncbi:ankyrin repeat domain-containing protein [bacterium]|nr:MAG: ankyrin repeat domain-containing protein [bacterium]